MQNQLEKLAADRKSLSMVPQTAGVYIFLSSLDRPLYVGKATNLKKRLESYFSKTLLTKTRQMVTESDYFSFIRVTSELEALLLEANLVKRYQPRYNSQLKDDKHPLYIKITKDIFPQVLTVRRDQVGKKDTVYGPFPSSSSVRSTLKIIRRVFPYAQHTVTKRACLYNQIGLCNPCPSTIEMTKDSDEKERQKKLYKNNIRLIKLFLSGKLSQIKHKLENDMKYLADKEDFENARRIREKIKSIDYVTQPITPVQLFIDNPNLIEDIRAKESENLNNILKPFFTFPNGIIRVECFDVAHISGTHPTASMVTFVYGEPDKNLYRHFRIRQSQGRNDIESLKEVAKRRIKYSQSWGLSDLIVVDGGKAQLKVFLEVFKGYDVPIVGLAKRFETLVIGQEVNGVFVYKELRVPRGPSKNLLQRVRNEAHRFARKYHFMLVKKSIIQK